jgi:hypothetical protein
MAVVAAGYVNSRIAKQGLADHGNLLLNLNFLALGETRAIETATENKRQKNNNDDSQKLTSSSPQPPLGKICLPTRHSGPA